MKGRSASTAWRIPVILALVTGVGLGVFTMVAHGQNAASGQAKQQGVWQYCSSVSGAALDSFMKAYPFSDSPEPGGA